jgi:hypothetical protein
LYERRYLLNLIRNYSEMSFDSFLGTIKMSVYSYVAVGLSTAGGFNSTEIETTVVEGAGSQFPSTTKYTLWIDDVNGSVLKALQNGQPMDSQQTPYAAVHAFPILTQGPFVDALNFISNASLVTRVNTTSTTVGNVSMTVATFLPTTIFSTAYPQTNNVVVKLGIIPGEIFYVPTYVQFWGYDEGGWGFQQGYGHYRIILTSITKA